MNFRKNFQKVYSSEFFKHSAALLSSNTISQIISFAIYPVITRIYAPEVFGDYSWFINIVGILTILFTGRYDLAIALPKSEKKSIALFQLSTLVNICFLFLFIMVFLIWKNEIALLLNRKNLASLLPFIPLCAFLAAMWQILSNYFIRKKKYYNISTYNIVQSIMGAGSKVILGFKGLINSGLIVGHLLGQLISIVASVLKGKTILKSVVKVNFAEIKQVAHAYSNFPKYELPNGLLNIINLPILLLPFFFGMEKMGLFSLAFTIGLSPVSLFSYSVYQVLLQRMSEKIHNKQFIKKECFLFCKTCMLLILPVFIIFVFIPENFFVSLFGSNWEGVGYYLKIMLPWLFLVILVASLSFIPDLFFRQKKAMSIEIAYILCRTVALLTGVYFQDFNLSIILFCIVSAIVMLIKLIWYFYLIKKYESSLMLW